MLCILLACADGRLKKPSTPDIQQTPDIQAVDTLEDAGQDISSHDGGGDTSVDGAADTVLADVSLSDVSEGVFEGFRNGGLFTTYADGSISAKDAEMGPIFLKRVEPVISITTDDDFFRDLNQQEPFTAHMKGAVWVDEAGLYTFSALATGLVYVKVNDVVVLDDWTDSANINGAAQLALGPGWHPIEIIFAEGFFHRYLQVWMRKGEDAPVLLSAANSGYASEVSGSEGDLSGIVEPNGPTTFRKARYLVRTTVPSRLSVEDAQGMTIETIPQPDVLSTSHEVTVLLEAGTSYEPKIILTDLWDREATIDAPGVETAPLPEYVSGGLMGTYHEGTNFGEIRGERIDPRIRFPEDAPGLANESFGIWMPKNGFSVRWEGGVLVPERGLYTFYWGTDDGQRIYLDGEVLAENFTNHALSYLEAQVYLDVGWYPLTLEMYENNGVAQAYLEWSGPGISRVLIAPDRFGYVEPEPTPGFPLIQELQTTGNDDEERRLVFKSTELVTAIVHATGPAAEEDGPELDITYEFTAPATTFSVDVLSLGVGETTITVDVTDRTGVPAEQATTTIVIQP